MGTVSHHCRGDNVIKIYKFSDEIIDKFKELALTHTNADIAKMLGISIATVKKYKFKFGYTRKQRGIQQTAEDRKKNNIKYVMDNRKKTKSRAVEYLGGKCKICGYDKCVEALTFHHVIPNKKEFNISRTNIAWEKLKPELDKCVLLCHNCHDEVHAGITQLNIE